MKTKPITLVMLTSLFMLLVFGVSLEAATKVGAPSPVYVESPLVEDAEVGMRVIALVTLCKEGTVESVSIRQADAPGFAESVEEAVKQWRFAPAVRDGKPVKSRVLVPFRVAPARPLVAMQ